MAVSAIIGIDTHRYWNNFKTTFLMAIVMGLFLAIGSLMGGDQQLHLR